MEKARAERGRLWPHFAQGGRGEPEFGPQSVSQSTIVWEQGRCPRLSRGLCREAHVGQWTACRPPRQFLLWGDRSLTLWCQGRPTYTRDQSEPSLRTATDRGRRRPSTQEGAQPRLSHLRPNASHTHGARKGPSLTDASPCSSLSPRYTHLAAMVDRRRGRDRKSEKSALIQKRLSYLKYMLGLVSPVKFNCFAIKEEQIDCRGRKKKPFFPYLTNRRSTFAPPLQYCLHFFMLVGISFFSPNQSIWRWLREFRPRLRKALLKYAGQRRIELITGIFIGLISGRWELGRLLKCYKGSGRISCRAATREVGHSHLKIILFLFVTFVVSLSYFWILLWKYRKSCFINRALPTGVVLEP